MTADWLPIDDVARDGSWWPAAWEGQHHGIARFRDGQWEALVDRPATGFVPCDPPAWYFVIPDPP